MVTCKLSSCARPSKHLGFCSGHYSNLVRYGSPHGGWKDTTTPDFKGLGVIACNMCGNPTRDHRIGRCPEWT